MVEPCGTLYEAATVSVIIRHLVRVMIHDTGYIAGTFKRANFRVPMLRKALYGLLWRFLKRAVKTHTLNATAGSRHGCQGLG